MLSVGEAAPDFELISDTGKPLKLSDFRGQKVIVFFYPKADTPGCTTQACGFRDHFPVIQEANATVLGISPDTPADLAKWKVKQNLPYALLSDLDHQVAEAYGVWGTKKMFNNVYDGIIRSHFVIDPEGKVADIQIKVSPADSVSRAIDFVGVQ